MNDFSSINSIVGSSKIKYSTLNDMFSEIDIPQNHIMMYVDAHSILYRLYRQQNLKKIEIMREEVILRDLVVGFVNVLGHYRRYFATRLHKNNTIIVSCNMKQPKYQATLYDGYNESYNTIYSNHHKDYGFMNSLIKRAYKYICSIAPYFERIYCIQLQHVDDFSIAYRSINDNNFNIIFSQNMLPTQLLSKNTIQLFNKHDKSYLITEDTCYSNGIMKKLKHAASDKLTPKDLLFIWSIGGCSSVEMKPTNYSRRIDRIVRVVSKLTDEGLYYSDMSFKDAVQLVEKELKVKELIDYETLYNRYRVLDIKSCSKAMSKDQLSKIRADIYDIYNEHELEKLNEDLATLIGTNEELININSLNMSEEQGW